MTLEDARGLLDDAELLFGAGRHARATAVSFILQAAAQPARTGAISAAAPPGAILT